MSACLCYGNRGTLTDGKHPNHPVNGDANDTLALFLATPATRTDELHTNVDRRLLAKANNLGAGTPIPAYECLVSTCRHQVLGRQCDRADAVEMASELLEGSEGKRREEVHTPTTLLQRKEL